MLYQLAFKELSIFVQEYNTVLHKASGAGHTAVITLLLDHGLDIHTVAEVCTYVGNTLSHSTVVLCI